MLEELLSHFGKDLQLAGIITGADKPSGRGMNLKANPVKKWALEKGISFRQPEKIGPPELDWLREIGCDLLLVMSYGHILKQELLDLPKLGAYNIHTSVLPAYRGASPIETAIAEGENETGVTFMGMVRKMDAGPMLNCEKASIGPEDTTTDLREKLSLACLPLLRRGLPAVLKGEAKFHEQNPAGVSYTRLLKKSDGILDFQKTARQLANRIRALQPWPGCFFECNGVRIKVGKASVADSSEVGRPGEALETQSNCLEVATGDGTLQFMAMQRPGGKMLPAGDFLRGFPITPGTLLTGGDMAPLSSPTPFAKK